eukprot:scaffold7340_cov266-Pinguiococcus_pyrenoidosus.AAC.60
MPKGANRVDALAQPSILVIILKRIIRRRTQSGTRCVFPSLVRVSLASSLDHDRRGTRSQAGTRFISSSSITRVEWMPGNGMGHLGVLRFVACHFKSGAVAAHEIGVELPLHPRPDRGSTASRLTVAVTQPATQSLCRAN